MEKSRPVPSHQRLRELLAIPERKRTEEEWAEINELEITLTPANRAVAQEQNVRRKGSITTVPPKSRDGPPARQTVRKLRKKPSGGGGGGRQL